VIDSPVGPQGDIPALASETPTTAALFRDDPRKLVKLPAVCTKVEPESSAIE
jgi:hypothetical protein